MGKTPNKKALELFYKILPWQQFKLVLHKSDLTVKICVAEDAEPLDVGKIHVITPSIQAFSRDFHKESLFWHAFAHEVAHCLEIPKHHIKLYNFGLKSPIFDIVGIKAIPRNFSSIAAAERELRVLAIQENLKESFDLPITVSLENTLKFNFTLEKGRFFAGMQSAALKFKERTGEKIDIVEYVNQQFKNYRKKYEGLEFRFKEIFNGK